jgi:hypothetical protein
MNQLPVKEENMPSPKDDGKKKKKSAAGDRKSGDSQGNQQGNQGGKK